MRPCAGVRDGHFGYTLSTRLGVKGRLARVRRGGVGREDAAVPGRGVLADAHVGGEQQLREELGQELQAENDGRVGVVGDASAGVLGSVASDCVEYRGGVKFGWGGPAHLLHLHGHSEEDHPLEALLH